MGIKIERYELPESILHKLVEIAEEMTDDIIKRCEVPETVAILLVAGILNKFAWHTQSRAIEATEDEPLPRIQ